MTAAAQPEVAGSGRSAPPSGHLNRNHNEGGKSVKPAAVLPPKWSAPLWVDSFR